MHNISESKVIPAPVGGLNTVDSLADMPHTDAIVMRNFFPEQQGCSTRKGFRKHVVLPNGGVETLIPIRSVTGTSKLWAIDQKGLVDVTVSRTAINSEYVFDLVNPQWQYVNFANAAGVHALAFNGQENGLWFDPATSTWKRLVLAAVPATPVSGEWAGIDPKKLIQTCAHQKRIWAVEKDSTRGWYLPPEQVWGIAKSFDFGGLFQRGGYLQSLTTWTMDSGDGMDDLLIAISSGGEVAIFDGIDPNSSTTWSLRGVFTVGDTFTRRCFSKFGTDVMILTQYGLLTLNAIVGEGLDGVAASALARKVQPLVSQLATERGDKEGWQLNNISNLNTFVLNIPSSFSVTENFQLVMNSITGAWCEFIGFQAQCWAGQYFGADGVVAYAFDGALDDVDLNGVGGKAIICDCQQGFDYFDAIGRLKHFKLIQPSFLTGIPIQYSIAANMDFSFTAGTIPSTTSSGLNVGLWGYGTWGTSLWGGTPLSQKEWSSIVGLGFAASVRLSMSASVRVTWVTTTWVYEVGGII